MSHIVVIASSNALEIQFFISNYQEFLIVFCSSFLALFKAYYAHSMPAIKRARTSPVWDYAADLGLNGDPPLNDLGRKIWRCQVCRDNGRLSPKSSLSMVTPALLGTICALTTGSIYLHLARSSSNATLLDPARSSTWPASNLTSATPR